MFSTKGSNVRGLSYYEGKFLGKTIRNAASFSSAWKWKTFRQIQHVGFKWDTDLSAIRTLDRVFCETFEKQLSKTVKQLVACHNE